MEHEVYINTNKDIFYINNMDYKEVFSSLDNVNVKMETLIMLDSNNNYSSIFSEGTKKFSENLVALKKECTGVEIAEIIDNTKEIVFSKCGHYICCKECAINIFEKTKKCPICRNIINSIVNRDQIQL
jgi:hypothetical protein